jgi:hypothetical protein
MSVKDEISLRWARSHIDADAATARHLLDYRLSEREIAGSHSTETFHPPQFLIPVHFHDLAAWSFSRNVKPVQYGAAEVR